MRSAQLGAMVGLSSVESSRPAKKPNRWKTALFQQAARMPPSDKVRSEIKTEQLRTSAARLRVDDVVRLYLYLRERAYCPIHSYEDSYYRPVSRSTNARPQTYLIKP